jgi:hypothetical protein
MRSYRLTPLIDTVNLNNTIGTEFMDVYRELWTTILGKFTTRWLLPPDDIKSKEFIAQAKIEADIYLASKAGRLNALDLNVDGDSESKAPIQDDAYALNYDVADWSDDSDSDHDEEETCSPMCTHKKNTEGYMEGCACQQRRPVLNKRAVAAVARLCNPKNKSMDSLLILYKHTQRYS